MRSRLEQEFDVTDDAAKASPQRVNEASGEDLRRLGITAHEHTTYEWNGYRYSSASDAIAAAKRASR